MSQCQVLIVEDEPGITDNIVFVLEQDSFSCHKAATAAAAREIIAQHAIDFVVLDVGLPDEDGFSFCRELRKTNNVPILFLTARADVTDRVVGLELGADDYMCKPFSPRELLARVKSILRRQTLAVQAQAADPEAMPFVVDEEKRRIHYFGCVLDLSRYEFDLLHLLIKNPGIVYSRSELLDAVWDEPSSSYDRTVDTHIKTIRAKLKLIKPEMDAVETRRGLGYALREDW